MREIPKGTVTFLFSDVEGSTRLATSLGDDWTEVLEEHRRLLRTAFDAHGGYEVKTEGDGFFVSFQRARDAVLAAADAQLAIEGHAWSDTARIRVRIGVHTGDVTVVDDDYVGLAVHHAARIAGVAHGAQIVLSDATRQLAGDVSPVTTLDLGEHQLKDIDETVLIHQALHPLLPSQFPPLRVTAGTPTNLPAQLTSFVGRDEELRIVTKLIGDHRLVTLSGAGGAGKTRLALETAGGLVDGFPDGIWLIELAKVTDPELIDAAIADVLGLRTGGEGRDARSTSRAYFSKREALLVLDNCEHVIAGAAAVVDDLLHAAPGLRVLATSREALGIGGEHAWRVPSLAVAVDDSGQVTRESPAVRLFLDRADAVGATFPESDEELAAIAHVCRRLDGMPLAIELAAARTRSMAPSQLATRLDDRFRLLTGGSRTALPRQQTLQALIDWSHQLLDERERAVLRRSSVFVGGFTLEAAEVVCATEEVDRYDVIDLLDSLVAKSLLVPPPADDTHYRLLETIRGYARQKLLEADEVDSARDTHLAWVVASCAEARPYLTGPDQAKWLDAVEDENENVRAALEWATEAPGRGESALEIADSIWIVWWTRGHWREAIDWLVPALAAAPDAPDLLRAQALWSLAFFQGFMGDPEGQQSNHAAAHALREAAGDRAGLAASLYGLAHAAMGRGETGTARELFGKGAELAEETGENLILGWCLLLSSSLVGTPPDEQVAGYERAATLAEATGDRWNLAMALGNLSFCKQFMGDLGESRRLGLQAAGVWRETGDVYGGVSTFTTLAHLELTEGSLDAAVAWAEEALELANRSGLDRLRTGPAAVIATASLRTHGWNPTVESAVAGFGEKEAFGGLNIMVWSSIRAGCTDLGPLVEMLDAATPDAVVAARGNALHTVAEAMWLTGDERAISRFEEVGQVAAEQGNDGLSGMAALGIARCRLDAGDIPGATRLLRETKPGLLGGEMADSALCAMTETLAAASPLETAAAFLGAFRARTTRATGAYDITRADRLETTLRSALGGGYDQAARQLVEASNDELVAAFLRATD